MVHCVKRASNGTLHQGTVFLRDPFAMARVMWNSSTIKMDFLRQRRASSCRGASIARTWRMMNSRRPVLACSMHCHYN